MHYTAEKYRAFVQRFVKSSPGSTPLFGLNGYVPPNRVWFSGISGKIKFPCAAWHL